MVDRTDSFNFTWGLPELEELGFVQVYQFMLNAYAELGVTRQEFLCLIHLASYHFNTPDSQGSKPGLEQVAKLMGYGDKSRVSNLVTSLEKKGMLRVTRRPGFTSIYDASPFAAKALHLVAGLEKAQGSRAGLVYLIGQNGLVKIGVTTNLNRRLKELGVEQDDMLFTIDSEDAFALESILHKRFAEKRVNGEWFDLTAEDIEWIANFKPDNAKRKGVAHKRNTLLRQTATGVLRSTATEEEKKKKKNNNLPPAGGGSFKQPPIGGGVVVHDLDEVAFHLEHTGRRKGDLEAQCPHCGAGHTQETNACPDCQAHVVWLNSPAWKRLHGDPKRYLRELQGEDLKAVGPLEVEFCRTFNYRTEFANRTQQREFRRLANKYPAGYLQELMVWANGKGFQALKGAVENPDNLTRWQNKQYEETQPGADNDQPSGWELQALQVAREKG